MCNYCEYVCTTVATVQMMCTLTLSVVSSQYRMVAVLYILQVRMATLKLQIFSLRMEQKWTRPTRYGDCCVDNLSRMCIVSQYIVHCSSIIHVLNELQEVMYNVEPYIV